MTTSQKAPIGLGSNMGRWLPLFSVTRPVTAIMGFVALIVLGAIAFARIPLDMLPSGFEGSWIWIYVPYKNTTPVETEKRIVRPVEESLATVAGIKELSSEAKANGASVELEFHGSVDMGAAYNQVVDRMERVLPDLPSDVENYYIYRWNPADEPKIWAGLTFADSVEDPYRLVTQVIQRRLERIPGMGQVEIWGVDEKSVWVDFDRESLASHGVDLAPLLGRLATDNFQLSGGRITDRGQVRYIRSLARLEDPLQLAGWPVKPGVALSDVASVAYKADPSKSLNRINGQTAAGVGIYKESGANTVELCDQVHRVIAELEQDPRLQGVAFHIFFDQGKEIESAIGNLRNAGLEGGLFAILILWLFLREWRMTLLIAGCIPFSLLITVAILYFTGESLNLLSMAGMMIAVGMVVDNAIVVVETIFHARQAGLPRKTAAVEGTAEVALAITLSTLTHIVVFLPLILMSENAIFSFFMKQLGLPICFALGASLLVALSFSPLTTTFLRKRQIKADPAWLVRMSAWYDRSLRRVLRHRVDAFLFLLVLLVLTVRLPGQTVGCREDNDDAASEFVVRYSVPGLFGQEDRLATVKAFESWAEEHRDKWGIRLYRTRLREGSQEGSLYVTLQDAAHWPEGAIDAKEVVKAAKRTLPDLPGVRCSVGWEGDTMGRRSVAINVYGDETEVLEGLSDEIIRRIETIPGVMSARPATEISGPYEVRLQVDRDAIARYDLSAEAVGRSLSFAMRGLPLRPIWMENQEVGVFARFADEERHDLRTLLDFPLFVGGASASQLNAAQTAALEQVAELSSAEDALAPGATLGVASVPLRAVVEPQVGRGYSQIRRENRRTGMSIQVDLGEGLDPEQALAIIDGSLKEMTFPRGYSWDQGRAFEEQEESDTARGYALILSIAFVFLIMGMLFESFVLPMAVITTVPMAFFGVWWTLFLTGTPLDIMGGVGLVVLVGVVVNNGIVFVDLVTRLRARGMDRTEALVMAGTRRMRPILMTALTTFFGLLPMALGTSTFLDIPYAPMGRVVAGGLATATVLTLFFVPLAYTMLDDLRGAAGRWLAWVGSPEKGRSGAISSS